MLGEYLSKDRPVSNYSLGLFERSPLHYKYFREHNVFERSAIYDLGKVAHKLLLNPHTLTKDFAIYDINKRADLETGMTSKANKAWLVAIEAQAVAEKKELLSKEIVNQAAEVAENVFRNPQARELLTAEGNRFEIEKKWTYNGVPCLGIVDVDNDFFLVDVKTAENADPWQWQRKSWYYKYPRQGGMYLDGDARGDYKLNDKPFIFLVVEKTPPYDVSIHELSNDLIAYGINQYRVMVDRIKHCEKTGEWPGYVSKSHSGTFTWELPKWAQNE